MIFAFLIGAILTRLIQFYFIFLIIS